MASGHDNVMDEIQRLAMQIAAADDVITQNAQHMYAIYRAYVKAGFIESQAFELTKIALKGYTMQIAFGDEDV